MLLDRLGTEATETIKRSRHLQIKALEPINANRSSLRVGPDHPERPHATHGDYLQTHHILQEACASVVHTRVRSLAQCTTPSSEALSLPTLQRKKKGRAACLAELKANQ